MLYALADHRIDLDSGAVHPITLPVNARISKVRDFAGFVPNVLFKFRI